RGISLTDHHIHAISGISQSATIRELSLPHPSTSLYPSYFFSTNEPLPRISSLFPYPTLFRSWPRVLADPQGGPRRRAGGARLARSEEHTSELQSRFDLVCRLLLEKKKLTFESGLDLYDEDKGETCLADSDVTDDICILLGVAI